MHHPCGQSRGSYCNKRPILRVEYPPANVSLARSPASLLITSWGIHQPSGPSHDTTQSNKPPAVYIYSGRASSSALGTETRLGKRASHAARPTCIFHLPGRRYNMSVHSSLCRSICLHNTDMHQEEEQLYGQTRTGSCSGTSSLVACTILLVNHTGHNLISGLFRG
jgi:hypothetical protein